MSQVSRVKSDLSDMDSTQDGQQFLNFSCLSLRMKEVSPSPITWITFNQPSTMGISVVNHFPVRAFLLANNMFNVLNTLTDR